MEAERLNPPSSTLDWTPCFPTLSVTISSMGESVQGKPPVKRDPAQVHLQQASAWYCEVAGRKPGRWWGGGRWQECEGAAEALSCVGELLERREGCKRAAAECYYRASLSGGGEGALRRLAAVTSKEWTGHEDYVVREMMQGAAGGGKPKAGSVVAFVAQQALELGAPGALFLQALLVLSSGGGREERFRWLEAAAGKGHAGALYHLGRAYAAGAPPLTRRDYVRARGLYREAALYGHPGAMLQLGMMCERYAPTAKQRRGMACPQALHLAVLWYSKAVEAVMASPVSSSGAWARCSVDEGGVGDMARECFHSAVVRLVQGAMPCADTGRVGRVKAQTCAIGGSSPASEEGSEGSAEAGAVAAELEKLCVAGEPEHEPAGCEGIEYGEGVAGPDPPPKEEAAVGTEAGVAGRALSARPERQGPRPGSKLGSNMDLKWSNNIYIL